MKLTASKGLGRSLASGEDLELMQEVLTEGARLSSELRPAQLQMRQELRGGACMHESPRDHQRRLPGSLLLLCLL